MHLHEFDALPIWEQFEYLAEDEYRQSIIDAMLAPIKKRIANKESIDLPSYYMLWLAKLGG